MPSFTVRTTLNFPSLLKVFVTVLPVAVVPSPKFHEYVSRSPSGSLLPLPSNVTTSGFSPLVLSAVATAVGARLPVA